MDTILNFAEGPLFRLSFGIMVLGLIRMIVLSLMNGFEARRLAKDKAIPTQYVNKLTFGFLFPIRAFRVKPFYSIFSIAFHIGLIATPLLLFDHALLFKNSINISWLGITLGKDIADWLTILTVLTGIALLLYRIAGSASRALSRKQDYLWPVLLIIPFVTGFICANYSISPDAYIGFMLAHVLSGELIFILLPFSKIAHCVLMPIGQWIVARSWKFIPGAPEEITISLGKEGQKL